MERYKKGRITMTPHRKSKGNGPVAGGGKSVRVKVESKANFREMVGRQATRVKRC